MIQDSVATMPALETDNIVCYHLLNKNANSSESENLISGLLIVDKTNDRARATILGTYISSNGSGINNISLKTDTLSTIDESSMINPIKYPTDPPEQGGSNELMIATPSISNLRHQNGHLTGTIDVTVGGIFSWDVIGFDIDLKKRTIKWWWID
ncbi:MAG TPA: hypothetical protein PKX92_05350 [Edaphocola sp.]|nr:hypothetical protein [Edaphocola sp.]